MTTTIPAAARPVAPGPAPEATAPRRLHRLVRGRPTDPAWVRPALLGLLVATACLYLIDLSSSGWANSFYSAAVQAGAKSWKAMFFGSSDAANFITVDKPPAALWVMDISARIFGVNAWSILVPQALEGVATVGLLYLAVRRTFSAGAGLIAGAVLALTPVATLMFRFNNPDALLALLMVGATYATVRAVQDGRTRWLVLAGALVGLGFITKELQALIIVPALALAYLVAGPVRLRKRLLQLLAAGVAIVVAAGWWITAVQLTPAADRPYIGGSQDNSLWNLIFGYNGFGRLTGNETGSVGGGGPTGGGGWGATGIGRMFGSEFGSQIAWLLPAALLALVAGLWLTRRARRIDPARAALIAWGGALVVTGLVFSLGKGIIHPYYSVALAPAIGALVGAGAAMLWHHRHHLAARLILALGVGGTAVWADALLRRSPTWHPWLQAAVLVVGGIAVLGLVLLSRKTAVVVAIFALVASLGVPGAASIATAATPHSGAIPSASPGSGFGFGGGGRFGRFGPGARLFGGGRFAPGGSFGGGPAPGGSFAGGPAAGSFAGGPGGSGRGGFGGRHGGGGGGLLDGSTPSATLTAALKAGASSFTWVAAAVGSEDASGYQLATGDPVMAIGGFNGTDPAPSLAAFQKLVAEGRIHYFVGGRGVGGFGGRFGGRTQSGSGDATAITQWVEQHFTARTVGGTTVYDLTERSS